MLLGVVLGVVLVLVGVLLLAVAALGATGRIRRNRVAGIKTPATMTSQAAFAAAHRAAAVPLAAAGVVPAVTGAVLIAGAGGALAWIVLVVGVVGTGVLAGVGGLVGDRAAVVAVNTGRAADPAPDPGQAATCAGVCAGCDLVAGCRTAAQPKS